MSGLPSWAEGVQGFDVTRWWVMVVCMHGAGNFAAATPITIGFEDEVGDIQFMATEHVHLERFESGENSERYAAEMARPRVRGDRPDVRRRQAVTRGSINFTCPGCSITPRLPRSVWAEALEASRRRRDPVAPIDVGTLR